MKNRLFFFGGWERYAAARGIQVNYSVPSAKMRNGDFSEAAVANPGFVLYNPFTGGAGGAGRVQFANNTIPANLISPIWQKALTYYPVPTTRATSTATGSRTTTCRSARPATTVTTSTPS